LFSANIHFLYFLAMRISLLFLAAQLVFGARISMLDSESAAVTNNPCLCSETGVVDYKDTGKPGCEMHFGLRFGYICYVNGGANCKLAKPSRANGVYWRSCLEDKERLDAQDALQKAMLTIKLEEIKAALVKAKDKGVDVDALKRGSERVTEVEGLLKLKDELLIAIAGVDTQRLLAALEKVEQTGLDGQLEVEIMDKAKHRLALLRRREDAAAELEEAISGHSLQLLEGKLQTAKALRLDRELIVRGDARVTQLMAVITAAQNELAQAMRGRDPVALNDAIRKATRLDALSNPVEAAARLVHLNEAAVATQHLEQMIPKWKLQSLEAALTQARQKDADPAMIASGAARLKELTELSDVARTELRAASKGTNEQALTAAIKKCLPFPCVDAPELKAAMARSSALENRNEAREMLIAELAGSDLLNLQESLDTAIDLGVEQAVVDKGKARVAVLKVQVKQATEFLQAAIKGHDEVRIQWAKTHAANFHNAVDQSLLNKADERLGELKFRDEAKVDLQAAMTGINLKSLLDTHARAADLGVDEATLKTARAREAEIRTMMRNARNELENQIRGHSSVQCESALREVLKLNIDDVDLVKRANDRLRDLVEIDKAAQILISASQGENMGNMIRAMQQAQARGVDPKVLKQGNAAMDVLRKAMHNAKVKLDVLVGESKDKAAIEEALAMAVRLNAVSAVQKKKAEDKIAELR